MIVSPLVALMDDQVKEAAKLGHSLVCTMIEKSWRGISALFLVSESWILNPKWRAMLASILYQDNLVAIVVDEAHVAYKW